MATTVLAAVQTAIKHTLNQRCRHRRRTGLSSVGSQHSSTNKNRMNRNDSPSSMGIGSSRFKLGPAFESAWRRELEAVALNGMVPACAGLSKLQPSDCTEPCTRRWSAEVRCMSNEVCRLDKEDEAVSAML